MPLSTTPGFEFIARPIQRLFITQPGNLTTILRALTVLAVRYRRKYIHTVNMDWNLKFDTAIPFLEDCLTSTSARDLAYTLTIKDKLDFVKLSQQSILSEDSTVRRILDNWHALKISVWECCSALPDLTLDLQNCAQVSLSRELNHERNLIASIGALYRSQLSFSNGHPGWPPPM